MVCCREIDEYLDYCEKNPDKISDEVKLLISNIVLPTLKRTDIFFDIETYYKQIKFIELWYYQLFPFQKFINAFMFMYDENDSPIFKTFVIVIGRGNGKDGWIIPTVGFFTTELYGVKNYNVDMLGNSVEQIEESFSVFYNMLEENEEKMNQYFEWTKKKITNISTGSTFKYRSTNNQSADGRKPGCLLLNEYHALPVKKKKTVNTNKSGLGKVKHPRTIIISTNGTERDGTFDELMNTCSKVLSGKEKKLKYFPFICRIHTKEEANNRKNWPKANPSYEFLPTLRQEIEDQFYEMKYDLDQQADFYSKRMGVDTRNEENSVTSWENVKKACYSDIDNKIAKEMPELTNNSAILGIDFASLNDLAVVGFLAKNNNEYIFRFKAFVCKKSKYFSQMNFPFEDMKGQQGYLDYEIIDDDFLSEDLIANQVMEYISELNVKRILLDNYKLALIKKALLSKGLTLYHEKKNPDGIIEIIRYPASCAAIVGPKLELLFSQNKLNFGDSALMRWSIGNTYMIDKKDGNKYFEKVEPKLRKNDPFMALVCTLLRIDLLEESATVIYSY